MISSSQSINPWRAVTYIVPVVSIVLAILMMPLPIGPKLFGLTIMPSFPLLAVFLWTVYRPALLPAASVLLCGLFYDLLINGPVGCSSIVFLVIYAVTRSQRVYWITLQASGMLSGFIFIVFLAEILSWATASFSFGHLLSPTPALVEGIATVLFLPLARQVFIPLERLVGPGAA